MNAIQLLYAENVIARTPDGAHQRLGFCVSVENRAVEKRVEIHWAGRDGVWRTLPAHYARASGENREVWEAETSFVAPLDTAAWPGDVTFAVRCTMNGADFWDSNGQQNYSIRADSGVLVPEMFPLLAVKTHPLLRTGESFFPVTVALHHTLHPARVFVHWTSDHWRHVQVAECYFWRRHWEKTHASEARNPNDVGTAIWITHLPVHDAYRVEYAVGCETHDQARWDNNFGLNYTVARSRLKVMTLNLHCCQEDNQDAKFSTIAQAIDDHDVDIVCFQEVAEPWNHTPDGFGANSARLIASRLKQHYHLVADWSHRGFEKYKEGSAILSRHDIALKDSGYVSTDHDPNSIHARKIVMAQVQVPYLGPVNIYSVHLSWWKDGFREQFESLRAWANEKQTGTAATLLLGDFNASAGSEGYQLATAEDEFQDVYFAAAKLTNSSAAVANYNHGRIDYIFLKKGSALEVKAAKVLFTDSAYGRVSDHPGFYAEFEPPL